jgi:hypothetical protein
MFKFINVERENNIKKRENKMKWLGMGMGMGIRRKFMWDHFSLMKFVYGIQDLCILTYDLVLVQPFLEFHGKGHIFLGN